MSLVGTTVGRIRIVDTLGKGGMGDVYLGFDEKLQRRVALKAIRDEQRVDAEAKARFLREARILSQLDHPCICRIHEFIEKDDSDFLVLEYIEGTSLRQVLRGEHKTSLKLYIAHMVAEALVAAHAKGIAHRDLKPENVMLTTDGEVKVLDFGLSYLTDERPAATLRSEAGEAKSLATDELASREITATLVASPDAARTEADTEEKISRTVLAPSAYPTFRPSSVTDGGELPTPGNIVETEVGTVQGTVAYMSPEQANGERVSVASDMYSFGLLLQELFTGRPPYEPDLKLYDLLAKAAEGDTLPVTGIDPDVATLVTRLKSVAPEARPTAVEAAERLGWIKDKPKRRLRRLAAAAVAVAFALGGLKYTYDLRRETNAAVEARNVAEEVSKFLRQLLGSADTLQASGRTLTVRDVLDVGAGRLEEFDDRPGIRSQLMYTIGRAYRQLGHYDEARPLLAEALELRRRQLGDEHPELPIYLNVLAGLYYDVGEYPAAEPLFREALEISEKVRGGDHPDVAASLSNLALLYSARDDAGRAEPLFRRALEIYEKALGADDPIVATSLNSLGQLYRKRGEHDRAEPFLRRAVEVQEHHFGRDDHPALVESLNNLAIFYQEKGDAEEAESLYRRTLEISEKSFGAEHPNVAVILNNFAELHRSTGAYDQARRFYVRALDVQEKALGTDHPAYATSLGNLADLLSATGKDERAVPLYLRALEIEEATFGADHPGLAVILADLGNTYTRLARFGEARASFERSLAITEQVLEQQGESRTHRHRLAATLLGLGRLYEATGDGERATETWARAAVVMAPLTEGSEVAAFLHTHAVALLHLGRIEPARPMVQTLLDKGWSRPELLELCRRHGLISPPA